MSRLFLRRERILPGPLKILQPVERRSPVPVKALALTSAALAAGLLLMPHLSPRLSVDPTPMVEFASGHAEPAALAYVEPEPHLVAAAAAPAADEPVVVSAPAPVARAASEPVRPAPATQAAAAPAKPVADTSLFQLDLLPVLQGDGADLDAGAVPAATPPRATPKAASRRNAAATRGTAVVASGGPAQH